MQDQPLASKLILELQRLYAESCLDKGADSFKSNAAQCELLLEEVSPPGEEWRAVWCASHAAARTGTDCFHLLKLATSFA